MVLLPLLAHTSKERVIFDGDDFAIGNDLNQYREERAKINDVLSRSYVCLC